MKKKPLGRGLESLIPRVSSKNEIENKYSSKYAEIDVKSIVPNNHQPRQDFDEDAMLALSSSIKDRGIMQPLVVMRHHNEYMLISGERRLRASNMIGLQTVPCIIVDELSDKDKFELALIENTQRDDLKPLELAKAYKKLMLECGYRQEDIAKIAGKSRSAVANTMRLLDLNRSVMAALEGKEITEGHARVFLSLNDEQCKTLLELVILNNLSVRETELYAKKILNNDIQKEKKTFSLEPNKEFLRKELESFFGLEVKLKYKDSKGTVVIKYGSEHELESIVNKLRG